MRWRIACRSSRPVPQHTLLIVEHDADLRALLADLFEGAGYRVLTAATARDGLHALHTEPVHVVVSEHALGDRAETGAWMLREAERHELLWGVRTMLYTGHRGLRASIPDRVVEKPSHIDLLLREVTALVRPSIPARLD